MRLKPVGDIALSMGAVLALVAVTVNLVPSDFGFHRLHGISGATREYREGIDAEALRRLVPVTVFPGLCGPRTDETSLQALYEYYGLMTELLPAAIEINIGARPQKAEDVEHHAKKVFKDKSIMQIPLTPEPIENERSR